MLANLKSAWAWIVAAVGGVAALLLYGWWREEQGRKEAEYRRRLKKLERQEKAHAEVLERTGQEDEKLRAKREGLRKERAELARGAIRELEKGAAAQEEAERLSDEEAVQRANDLLGL